MEERKPMSLADRLKASRNTRFREAVEFREKAMKKFGEKDARFFEIEIAPGSEARATVAIMPCGGMKFDERADADAIPFLNVYTHYFMLPNGKMYRENCPTMIGKPCPICDANSELWKAGKEDIARKRARKRTRIFNVYVKNYPLKPEMNGKVFLLAVKGNNKDFWDNILQRIPTDAKMFGQLSPSGTPYFDPFTPIGAPWLILKATVVPFSVGDKTINLLNLNKSDFDYNNPGMDDETFDKAYPLCYDLREIAKEKRYAIKEYEELKSIFLGGASSVIPPEIEKAVGDAIAEGERDAEIGGMTVEDEPFVNDVKDELPSREKTAVPPDLDELFR